MGAAGAGVGVGVGTGVDVWMGVGTGVSSGILSPPQAVRDRVSAAANRPDSTIRFFILRSFTLGDGNNIIVPSACRAVNGKKQFVTFRIFLV